MTTAERIAMEVAAVKGVANDLQVKARLRLRPVVFHLHQYASFPTMLACHLPLCLPPPNGMTRYPKYGKGHQWTLRELKAIPPSWQGDTLTDGGGLFGEVRTGRQDQVSVRFRYAFRWQGRVSWCQCGTWPTVPLPQIRMRRDLARQQVASGVNPNDQKRADRIERQRAIEATLERARQEARRNKTVAELVRTWIPHGTARKDQGKGLRQRFEKDVLPAIGHLPVRTVNSGDIRALLTRMVAERGVNRSAVVLLEDIQQMFRWACDEQPWRHLLVAGDPARRIKAETIVTPDYDLNNERDRILIPAELQELRDRFTASPPRANHPAAPPIPPATQLAVWIALSTLCRIGELLKAEWAHIRFDTGEWVIPRSNYKRTRRDKRGDYLVLLSPFARAQFQALHRLSGHSRWCFPARQGDGHVCLKSVSKHISHRQAKHKPQTIRRARHGDDALTLTAGTDAKWTPHDLRRTGSTMMQQLKVPNDIRNLCLNHSIGGKIDRTYGLHDFRDEKREAWARLGTALEHILANQGAAAFTPTFTPGTDGGQADAPVSVIDTDNYCHQ